MSADDDPMHIDNVWARRAADAAERDMYRDLAREIDGPPSPGMGTLIKRALAPDDGERTVAEEPELVCICCDSENADFEVSGIRCYDCGCFHPLD